MLEVSPTSANLRESLDIVLSTTLREKELCKDFIYLCVRVQGAWHYIPNIS